MSFNELVGLKIDKMYLSSDELEESNQVLIFEITVSESNNKKYYYYECCGECCNKVYVNSINGLTALLGETVISSEHKSSGDDGDGTEWDFWTISTNKGYCDIEVRNYNDHWTYGGDIYFRGNFDILKVFKDLKEIKQDF